MASIMKVATIIGTVSGAIGGTWIAGAEIVPVAVKAAPFETKVDSGTQYAALTAAIAAIQQHNDRQDVQDVQQTKSTALLLQHQFESDLANAKNDMVKHPSASATAYMCSLVPQINAQRKINSLPPMATPPQCQ